MTDRITNAMLTRTVLADLAGVADRLARTNAKLSSGKELTRPSDDPFAVSRALAYHGDLDANRQYQRNVEEASSWQTVTDTALASVGDLTLRVRELVLQGGTGTVDASGRKAIATEVGQLIEAVKSAGNTQYADRYVFSGSLTLTAPYTPNGADTYFGDTAALKREIGPGVQLDLNVDGSSVIGGGASGLLKTLRDVESHLLAGDTNSLQSGDLAALDTAQDAIGNARAVVGARAGRLDAAQERLSQLEEQTVRLLSETEDADIAKTLVDLSTQQAVYQSALKASAAIIQPSLLDFLR